MKLAALYTIYNGLELLNGSIKQIESLCDEIVICWQYISNKGEKSSQIKDFINQFKSDRFTLIEFVPDLSKSTKENERAKHQIMIDKAADLNCSHFVLLACDHYYDPDQFRRGKLISKALDVDLTFSEMLTYYKRPELRLDPPENYFMPFICKLNKGIKVTKENIYPVTVDPALRFDPWESYYIFNRSDLVLHHYSMIRTDIENKFRNAAASIRWTPNQVETFIREYQSADVGSRISYFQGRELIEVENLFNI